MRGVRCEECWVLLTIIMPPPSPAVAAPDSSQSIIRQVFTPHTQELPRHRPRAALRHQTWRLCAYWSTLPTVTALAMHHPPPLVLQHGLHNNTIPHNQETLPIYPLLHTVPWLQHLSTLHTYSQLDTGRVWRTASGGGTWSHSVRSRAAAERKIGADQRPATLAVFTDSRYVNR